ncbi:MAG: MotA/TolQ/ExbB proton channel family protein [Bacteroidota bacterium]
MINSILLTVGTTPAVQDSLSRVASKAEMADENLWDLASKGGWVMVPILLLSLISIYFIIERLAVIMKMRKLEPGFMSNIKNFILSGNVAAARELCKNSSSPEARMIDKGLSRIGKPIAEVEKALEAVGKQEVYRLEKNLNILSIVAGIAPLFGFIGTILGVIKIFYNISLADNISIGLISGGLYQKMVTSAAGLMVGVVAFIGFHWLNLMVDKIVHRIETNAAEFVDIIQDQTK